MKNLNGFRKSTMFCDFTLIVKDGVRIPVHRIAMIACSKYIRTLLTHGTCDGNVDSARLPDLTSTGVRAVVAFAYTGELEMYQGTVLEVLAAASFLQVEGVIALCDEYLGSNIMTMDNCVDIFNISESFPTLTTHAKVRRFILGNFEKIAGYNAFYELSCSQLASLLDENSLCVKSEFTLFKLVLKWIRYDVRNRLNDIATLIRNIRLPAVFTQRIESESESRSFTVIE